MRRSLSLIVLVAVMSVAFWRQWRDTGTLVSPRVQDRVRKEPPYLKYSFERLADREDQASDIVLDRILSEETSYTSYVFSFITEGKRVTGQANIPNGEGPFPVVVMLRGYIDPEGYTTGDGTRNGAAYFARAGYATFAPDFLGFGGSDAADEDTLGARLARPVTVLDLLTSLETFASLDSSRVFLWGHSNGGQIALSVLEVLGRRGRLLPATLWAPVSKPFPYNILYYTDESEDRGKALRRAIAEFEDVYDVDLFSIDRYFEWIASPLLIHQGTADDAVPREWSDELLERLEELELDVTYYVYPGADHNMRSVWDTVVSRDVSFFAGY